MSTNRIRLWDLPTRLFHWSLVLCIVASFISGQLGGNMIVWHGRIGLFIVGLITFRLVWGFIGSTYARFAQFFPSPAKLKAYLRGEWRGVGHNPLGAFSVFGLIGLIGLQVATGLCSNDDIAFVGPLYDLIDKSLSNSLSAIHELVSNVLIALVVMHIGAVIFHGRVKKDDLVKPMLTGHKEVSEGESARGGGLIAFVFAVIVACGVTYTASGIWVDQPPPPAATPSW